MSPEKDPAGNLVAHIRDLNAATARSKSHLDSKAFYRLRIAWIDFKIVGPFILI